MTETEFLVIVSEYLDRYFPKGKSKERGNALVVIGLIVVALKQQGLLKEDGEGN